MELNRKPYQGVFNIVRFNWHFYLIIFCLLVFAFFINSIVPDFLQTWVLAGALLAGLITIISLVISYYIYDLSDLYQLKWLPNLDDKAAMTVNAGFDETTDIIHAKSPKCKLTICDFYDSSKHTEISIKRARKAYPPKKNTIKVRSNSLPFEDNTFDYCIAILSAHEIRDEAERIIFFSELSRITQTQGQFFVTEHLRDFNNFLAYTIGFFHFHSKKTWRSTFEKAQLSIKQEIKTTPFITTFILEKNGNTL